MAMVLRTMDKMEKLRRILDHPLYDQYYQAIKQAEAERIYCRHDASHFADVARVAYILWLSGEVSCPELDSLEPDRVMEVVYAAAFLHDIGRFLEYADKNLDHALESERLSRPLLQEAGFSHAEAEIILKAIKNHRSGDTAGFDNLIYRADKESRLCYLCPALSGCKKYQSKPVPPVSI